MAIKKMVSEDAVVPETLQGETVKVATIGGKDIKAPVGGGGGTDENAVHYTAESKTDAQKAQARANIGAGTSSFSGNYGDLSGVPQSFRPSEHSHESDSWFVSAINAVKDLIPSLPLWLTPTREEPPTQKQVAESVAYLNGRIDLIEATSHPNMSIVGSPTFREGVVSGFSANDYLMFQTNVDVKENAVDFFMAFTTGANVTTQQNILDSWCGIAFAVLNGGTVTAASQNGTSFVTATSTGTISANTSYRLKLEFRHAAGSYTVTTKLATGSGEYLQIGGVVTLTAPVHPTATYWGGANPKSGVSHVFGGSINLAECRMDWNGKTVWRGYTEVPTYSKGVRDDGSPVDEELHGFFTKSNSLLDATIEAKVNSMFDNGDTTSYPRPTEG